MERAAAIIVGCVGVLILAIGAVFWVQSRQADAGGVDLLAPAERARSAGADTPAPTGSVPPANATVATAIAAPTTAVAAPTTAVAAPTTAVADPSSTATPAPAGPAVPGPVLAGVIDRVNHGGLRFAYRSATLEPAAVALLDQLAAALRAEPDVPLVVLGHTDSDGESADNAQLSTLRATAVIDHLVAAGVASGRLQALAMGETAPIASNDDEAGRQANRRVDLLVGSRP